MTIKHIYLNLLCLTTIVELQIGEQQEIPLILMEFSKQTEE